MRTYPVLSKAEAAPDGVGVALEHPPEESGTRAAARAVLEGRKKGLLAILPFLGPAFIACVAYIDPGNFATNIAGGSAFGYKLLWVIALANLMAMLLQTMSAKLGLATGKNLAELCRQEFRKPVVYAMWIVSEIMAMSTDLAEFLGASIAINLLFSIPLLCAVLRDRDVLLPSELGPGGLPYRCSLAGRDAEHPLHGWHYRGHGDAPCNLPALLSNSTTDHPTQ